MKYKECISLINDDYNNLAVRKSCRFTTYVMSPSFKVTFWFRIGSYFKTKKSLLAKFILLIISVIYKHYELLTGIWMPLGTDVGGGIFFSHNSGIVIDGYAKIGRGVRIYQCVTIGGMYGKGSAVIGDNVVLFAGAKIIGNVTIGNNVVVGANCVVVHDIPDNAVVVGVPGKVINYNGEIISKKYR